MRCSPSVRANIAAETDYSDLLGARMKAYVTQSGLAELLCESMKALATQKEFSHLVRASMADLSLDSDYLHMISGEVAGEFPQFVHFLVNLRRRIEIESGRYMPWDKLIDLTFGSLTNDPIEIDRSFEPDIREEIE